MKTRENNVLEITNAFHVEVECRGFITNHASEYLTNPVVSLSNKRKYILKKICNKALSVLAFPLSDNKSTKPHGIVSYCWGALN